MKKEIRYWNKEIGYWNKEIDIEIRVEIHTTLSLALLLWIGRNTASSSRMRRKRRIGEFLVFLLLMLYNATRLLLY